MSINNTNVVAILNANAKGIGRTDSLPALYKFNDDGTEFIVNNVGTAKVSPDIVAAKFIQLFHGFIKDMPVSKQVDHLNALSNNCVDLNQYKSLNKDVKAPKNSLQAERLLTPDEYKGNCIKLALDASNYDAIAALVDFQVTDKVTKTDLVQILISVQKIFFNDEQVSTYQVMIDKEIEIAKQFEGLTTAGFTDIVKTNNIITANLNFVDAGTAIPELARLGYKLLNSIPDLVAMQLKVVFEAGVPEALV